MSHLYATRNPMSEARRNYVNGPLVRETRGTIRTVLLVVGTFVAAMLFFIAIGVL